MKIAMTLKKNNESNLEKPKQSKRSVLNVENATINNNNNTFNDVYYHNDKENIDVNVTNATTVNNKEKKN